LTEFRREREGRSGQFRIPESLLIEGEEPTKPLCFRTLAWKKKAKGGVSGCLNTAEKKEKKKKGKLFQKESWPKRVISKLSKKKRGGGKRGRGQILEKDKKKQRGARQCQRHPHNQKKKRK